MPQINTSKTQKPTPAFIACVHGAVAQAWQDNLDCPPLLNLLRWMQNQSLTSISTQRLATPANNASFDDAVLAAITSSPNGVGLGDLGAILKHLGRPATAITPALNRLLKAKKIEKRGADWYAPEIAATGNGNIDRTSMSARRRAIAGQQPAPRRTRTRRPRTAAGAPQQQAAAAGD